MRSDGSRRLPLSRLAGPAAPQTAVSLAERWEQTKQCIVATRAGHAALVRPASARVSALGARTHGARRPWKIPTGSLSRLRGLPEAPTTPCQPTFSHKWKLLASRYASSSAPPRVATTGPMSSSRRRSSRYCRRIPKRSPNSRRTSSGRPSGYSALEIYKRRDSGSFEKVPTSAFRNFRKNAGGSSPRNPRSSPARISMNA